MAQETGFNFRFSETGAAAVGSSLDNMAARGLAAAQNLEFRFLKLSGTLSALGQVARNAGGGFSQLGNSLTNIAGTTAIGAQIGSAFGPQGAAFGAGLGFLTSAITELTNTMKLQQSTGEGGQSQTSVTNNVKMDIQVSGATKEEIIEQASARLGRAIDQINPGSINPRNMDEFTQFLSRVSRRAN